MVISAHFEENRSSEGQPRAARRRLLLETEGALQSGEATRVLVHNVSETGLLLETQDELEISEVIDLAFPEVENARARVIWSSGKLYGCAFDTPLSAATLSAAQLRSAAQNETGIGPAPVPAGIAAIGGESLGERLHRLRKLRGLTQGELASRLGVTSVELRPSRTVPGLPELIARCRDQIAAAVETTPDKIKIMIEL